MARPPYQPLGILTLVYGAVLGAIWFPAALNAATGWLSGLPMPAATVSILAAGLPAPVLLLATGVLLLRARRHRDRGRLFGITVATAACLALKAIVVGGLAIYFLHSELQSIPQDVSMRGERRVMRDMVYGLFGAAVVISALPSAIEAFLLGKTARYMYRVMPDEPDQEGPPG